MIKVTRSAGMMYFDKDLWELGYRKLCACPPYAVMRDHKNRREIYTKYII